MSDRYNKHLGKNSPKIFAICDDSGIPPIYYRKTGMNGVMIAAAETGLWRDSA